SSTLLPAVPRRRRLRADRLAQLLRAGAEGVQPRLQAAALLLGHLARPRRDAALVELPDGRQFLREVKEALEALALCVLLLDLSGRRDLLVRALDVAVRRDVGDRLEAGHAHGRRHGAFVDLGLLQGGRLRGRGRRALLPAGTLLLAMLLLSTIRPSRPVRR